MHYALSGKQHPEAGNLLVHLILPRLLAGAMEISGGVSSPRESGVLRGSGVPTHGDRILMLESGILIEGQPRVKNLMQVSAM